MAGYRKLSRTASQRKALIRNQVTALLYHGKIVTTEAKAKEIRRQAEHLITLAVREKDNFEEVTVKAKVVRKDKDGKRVTEVKDGKKVAIFNRIFETLLYDFYLLSQSMDAIFQKGINEKPGFVVDGHLQMERLLERFVETFDDLYGEHGAKNRKRLKGKKTEKTKILQVEKDNL